MRKGLFRVIILFCIVAAITTASILYIGIKHGSGNRALLTMRSGLIKIRRGLYEFGWGLRDFAFKGISKYRKETDRYGWEELQELDYERQELERLEELAAQKAVDELEKQQAAALAQESKKVMSE
jgi:hypothetical protein